MNLALQEQLFRSYPLFYRKASDQQDRNPIDYWGIEVADGWYELLDHLSAKIELAIADLVAGGLPLVKCPRAAKIKQKFGELQVVIDDNDKLPNSIDSVLFTAERIANETCEKCGSPGTVRRTNWIHVACDRYEQKKSDGSENEQVSKAELDQHFRALEVLLANRSKGGQ